MNAEELPAPPPASPQASDMAAVVVNAEPLYVWAIVDVPPVAPPPAIMPAVDDPPEAPFDLVVLMLAPEDQTLPL